MENGILRTFSARLEYLMTLDGLNIEKKGANIELAKKMLNQGCLDFYVNETNKSLDSARSQIEKHRKQDNVESISGKWLKAYCDYFKCSADFLFGYIDLPAHINTDIKKETNLSYESINILTDRCFKNIHAPALDTLLQMQEFKNFLFYIKSYIETLDQLSYATKQFHEEMRTLYPDVDKKEASNYLGESKIEKTYHNLKDKKNMQQFKIDMYCKTIIDSLTQKKAPDTD